jgi:asparagine synthetase B (glutamine-hydrolysing)
VDRKVKVADLKPDPNTRNGKASHLTTRKAAVNKVVDKLRPKRKLTVNVGTVALRATKRKIVERKSVKSPRLQASLRRL